MDVDESVGDAECDEEVWLNADEDQENLSETNSYVSFCLGLPHGV